MYLLKILIFQTLLFLRFSEPDHNNSSPRTGPKDLLVTINQVTQCESEPQSIETTNIIATFYSEARGTTLTGYKFTATFSEKKVHCSQVSNRKKKRLDHESFYQKILKDFYISALMIVKTNLTD